MSFTLIFYDVNINMKRRMKVNRKMKIFGIMTVTILIGALVLSGCSGTTKRTITVSGSTSVQPLMEKLADAYMQSDKTISVEVQGGGSSAGIKAVIDGVSNIGMSSRELTADEKATLTEKTIAVDCIAVVVNPANTVTNLTKDQITKIFKGEITNWKDVGGADKTILIVSREEGSGTRSAFEEMLLLSKKDGANVISLVSNTALIGDGNGGIKTNIETKENAIGYVSLAFADNTIKAVSIDGVIPSTADVKNKTYPISRPFLILAKGQPTAEAKAFLDFFDSAKGQEIISKEYILP